MRKKIGAKTGLKPQATQLLILMCTVVISRLSEINRNSDFKKICVQFFELVIPWVESRVFASI